MLIKNNNQGFTLVEVVIYVALFAIIIGGLIVTAYYLWQSASTTGGKVAAGEEINFVLKKLDWTLTGAEGDTVSTSSGELSFENPNISPDEIILRRDGDKIEMATGSNVYNLTSDNVKVESFDFSYDSPKRTVTVSFALSGIASTFTKFLKL
ncbi:MAG: prepilin-type N-terminal cleavage/methylation domain-containing protein [Patescibacteria group bacterium]